jgi:Lrp/AsnC family transcriptional regulator, regulator for asnA, asnC and gidA
MIRRLWQKPGELTVEKRGEKMYRRKKPPILDDLDQKIIQELQQDARQSYLSLGQKIGASEGTIRNRVALELKKELIKLKAVLNPPKLGFNFSCVVGIEVSIDKLTEAEMTLAESPNVYFLSGCTGTFDLMAILIFRDTQEFDKFTRNTLAKLPGIKRTQTFVNMRVIKNPWISDVDITRLLES